MTAPAINPPQDSSNYLVPSSGGTHCIPISGMFSGQPYLVDWRQFANDQFAFNPQGVFIDNTQGTGSLVISIAPIGWNITVPAGSTLQQQFPAPMGQTWSITGLGQALVIACDFPVLPNGNAVTVLGTANVNIVSPNPLPVQPTATAGGAPYQTMEIPTATITDMATVACANAAQTAVVPVNLARRKVTLSVISTAVSNNAIFFRKTGGANNLMEVQPGVTTEFDGTYGIDVRNDSGGAVSVMVFEES